MMSFRIVVILFVGMIVGYAQSESDKLSELVEVPEVGGGVIRLPLRVHLIQDVELEQKRVAMSMWVTMREFEEVVLPEINRIWEAAKIEWIIESIVEQPGAEIENREAAIETIENAKRNAAGKSDPARVPHLKALCQTPTMRYSSKNYTSQKLPETKLSTGPQLLKTILRQSTRA
jgi:hypothetical protein